MKCPFSRLGAALCAGLFFFTGAASVARAQGLAVTRATLANGLRVIAVRDRSRRSRSRC